MLNEKHGATASDSTDARNVSACPYFPPKRDMSHPFDPPPELLKWLDEPVRQIRLWDDRLAWVITRYEDVRDVLRNEACVSVDPNRPGFPQKSAAYAAVLGLDRTVRTIDNPEHGMQKRMLMRDFTVRRIAELETAITAMINQCIDEILAKGPPGDIYNDLAFIVPTWVICKLLGVPFDDRRFFADRSTACISHEVTFEEAAAAGQELYEYLDRIVTLKESNPEDDLLSYLVTQMREGNITRRDLIALARFLLIAGHDSTANTLGITTLALLQHPSQLEDMKANLDDRSYMVNAADELLRYTSVAHTGRYRVTIAEIKVGGKVIPAGEALVLANNAADRDETMFPDADRLDLRRSNARASLVFGEGIHQCLGQLLARREMMLYHRILWSRMPNLQLAVPFSQIKFNEANTVYAIETLPVTWS